MADVDIIAELAELANRIERASARWEQRRAGYASVYFEPNGPEWWLVGMRWCHGGNVNARGGRTLAEAAKRAAREVPLSVLCDLRNALAHAKTPEARRRVEEAMRLLEGVTP